MSMHCLSHRCTRSLFATLALGFAAQALAQVDSTVVVTASRVEQQVADAIPSTTVVTQSQIKASGAVDLPSLLRGVAGIETAQSGGMGTQSSLYLRGGSSTQTLVLIDGMRIESATAGTTAVEHLMLDQIERIEIVRGNVSALYGSGAMGGVVQIFTKNGAGVPGTQYDAMAGSRGTHKLAASYNGKTDDARVGLSVSGFGTTGFPAIDTRAAPGANPAPDGYRNTSISGLLAQRVALGHELGVRFYQAQGRTEFATGFGAPTDLNWAENAVHGASIFLDSRMADTWRSRISIADGADQSLNFLNGNPTSRFDTRNRQTTWQNDLTVGSDQTLTATVERLMQEVTSTTAYTRTMREVDSAAFGYIGSLGQHQLQAAVRRDGYSDFGVAPTGLIGYGYALTNSWKVIGMSSTAFRAPTFNDLFYPGFSTPSLRPEHSRSVEAGLQFTEDRTLARLTAYRTRYRDLIELNPVTFLPENVAHARVSGVEASYAREHAGWRVRMNLTRQNPINEDSGVQLARRARTYGGGEVSREFGDWRLAAEALASAKRRDCDILSFPCSNVTLGSYTVVNLSLRYRLDRSSEIFARIENAGDAHYQLAHGYNTPPRGIFIGVRWQPAK